MFTLIPAARQARIASRPSFVPGIFTITLGRLHSVQSRRASSIDPAVSWASFGPTSIEYSESFRARPYSRRFVRHLDGYYAQSHPEEDFAETIAIWLTPDLDWRNQYKGWKALEKLEYL